MHIRFILFVLVLICVRPDRVLGQTDSVLLPGTDVSFVMVDLPGGEFSFGETGHTISLSPFAISTHEVTHDAYRIFQVRDNDTPVAAEDEWDADAWTRPSPPYLDLTYGMGTRGGYPQVNTTQQAALRYCEWLFVKTGRFFRLPTEAEWEYACLAGQESDPTGLDDYAWLLENGEETYHLAGQKQPNAWGLYDMIGNVSEWTLDEYYADYTDRLGDGRDPWMLPDGKHSRTVRGGSFDSYSAEVGCRVREKSSPRWQARDPQIPKSKWWNVDSAFLGFRVVSPKNQPNSEEVRTFFAQAIVN